MKGEASPYGLTSKKLCNMCVLSLPWNFFVSHDKYQTLQIPYALHSKCVSFWGTSYSRPPIDPYLTSPLLQKILAALLYYYDDDDDSRTAWVSRYQKGKASLDLNVARDGAVRDGSGII